MTKRKPDPWLAGNTHRHVTVDGPSGQKVELDEGVVNVVRRLWSEEGIETYASCEGGWVGGPDFDPVVERRWVPAYVMVDQADVQRALEGSCC